MTVAYRRQTLIGNYTFYVSGLVKTLRLKIFLTIYSHFSICARGMDIKLEDEEIALLIPDDPLACNDNFASYSIVEQSQSSDPNSNDAPHTATAIPTAIESPSLLTPINSSTAFECDECVQKFKRASSLAIHKKKHRAKHQFECIVCKRLFNRKTNLVTHLRLHSGSTPFRCRFCSLAFKKTTELLKHEIFHTGDTSLQCRQCKLVLSCTERLEKHKRTHEPSDANYKCEVCGKDFAKFKNLSLHMRLHTGYKPFQCPVCNKRFSHCSVFIIHKRTHTGERPFPCKICKKRFPQSSNLITHMKSHASELGILDKVKTHLCGICGKLFSYKTHLIRHMRIHTGERPFRCEICDKAFTQSGSLVEHLRVHTGERPYKCEFCGKDFTQSGGLMQHIKKHKRGIDEVAGASGTGADEVSEFVHTGAQQQY